MVQKMQTFDEMISLKVTLEYHRNPKSFVLRSPKRQMQQHNLTFLILCFKLISMKAITSFINADITH